MNNTFYQILSYVCHVFSSVDTLGHHIHSPYLFEFVRMYVYDTNSYYSFGKIEKNRRALLQDKREIDVKDYGTGKSGKRLVSSIAETSLESKKVAQLLYRVIQFTKAQNIVELGTSLGITTAYLAAGNSKSSVMTFEGSEEIAKVAQENWSKLGLKNIDLVVGNIDDTLYNINKVIDFAFIDANHTEEATMRYFDFLANHIHEKSIIAIDDIHYSRAMHRAWKRICAREDVSATMNFYHIGLVFFDPHFMKRNYRLRI